MYRHTAVHVYSHWYFALKSYEAEYSKQVAVALPEPAGRGSIAPAPVRNRTDLEQKIAPMVYSAEQAPLGSHLEPVGRTVLERKVVVGRPYSLFCVYSEATCNSQ